MHAQAALGERQRDPAGPDAELEGGAASSEIDKEVDDRVDDGRRRLVGVPLVESLSDALTEVVLRHARLLTEKGQTPAGSVPWRFVAR